jgi:hypothetical protein
MELPSRPSPRPRCSTPAVTMEACWTVGASVVEAPDVRPHPGLALPVRWLNEWLRQGESGTNGP